MSVQHECNMLASVICLMLHRPYPLLLTTWKTSTVDIFMFVSVQSTNTSQPTTQYQPLWGWTNLASLYDKFTTKVDIAFDTHWRN